MRVLIADDNRDLAEALATLLRPRGADPVVVLAGDAAMDRARAEVWDAALIDLRLPGADAADLVTALTEQGRTRVFAMTGWAEEVRVAEALRAGAECVLQKPLELPELFGLLGLHREAQENLDGMRDAEVAVLAQGPGIDALRDLCRMTEFPDADSLRAAVADGSWHAAYVPGDLPEAGELVEDLKTLDPNLAVIREARRDVLASAVGRTAERRRIARELADLKVLFDRCPTALLVLDGPGPSIVSANRAAEALLGHRAGELAGSGPGELEGEGSVDRILTLVESVRADGAAATGRAAVRRRDGTERRLSLTAFPAGLGGHAVGLALRQAGQEGSNAEALQLLGATAVGIAHEMKNTMAGLSTSLSVLESRIGRGGDPADATAVLRRIRERVGRASEVMNDLLDFARPVTLRFQPVPATLLLRSVVDQLRPHAPPGVDVEAEVDDPSLRLMVDPVRLQLALFNLGSNALQAIGGPGEVRMVCRRRNGDIEILVSDDGPGIPVAHRDRIFQPFFTTRPSGFGLGLANVRKLVEAHGGRIELQPLSPGAHFRILLPPRPRAAARDDEENR